MSRHLCFALASFVFAGLLGACGEENNPPPAFVVSGTIQNNTQAPIPTHARVLVVWVVSSGSPDYSYVLGEGSLDPGSVTFSIAFNQPPPLEALNDSALGVGIIMVTTNQSIGNGDDISAVPETELIGAAGQYAVIYVRNPQQAAQHCDWAGDFETGYGVGIGVKVPERFRQVRACEHLECRAYHR